MLSILPIHILKSSTLYFECTTVIINEVIIAVYVYDNSKVHLPLYSRPLCFPFHNYLWFIIDEWRKGERATSLAISCANIFVSEAEVLKEMRRDHEIEAKETLNANEGWGWNASSEMRKKILYQTKEISYSNCILAVRIKLWVGKTSCKKFIKSQPHSPPHRSTAEVTNENLFHKVVQREIKRSA